jgi:hypothetical protein
MRWTGHIAIMGEMINAYKILVEKPVGKRLLGIHRYRCQDSITVDIREIGWGMWTGLIWVTIGTRAVANTTMKLRIP